MKRKITVNEFVEIWNNCSSRNEVSEKTGYTLSTINLYASSYRKLGHKLKKFKTSTPRFISKESFVEIWNNSSSRKEVSEKTGYTRSSVIHNSCMLRKEGFEIKKFKNTPPIVDRGLFVLIWNNSSSRKDVSDRTGYTISSVASVARRLRKAGFSLKSFNK